MVRLKNRWLLFEIIYEDTIQNRKYEELTSRDINSAIKDSVQQNFGDYGSGCIAASLSVKYFSPYTNIGIIRVSREHYNLVWSALTFITQIQSRFCLFRVLHLGAIEYNQDQLLHLKKQIEFHGGKVDESIDIIKIEESNNEIKAIEA
ncbi:3096_t:CDS:2 [Diversispora eburnea]|uniref:3096_t:CDS:1 n=1 Tax=Diversispora eburnea TaxID=1213867 RepID=A0A9N9GDI7_9GLOM|nr:3096_t:CDS:2 [Diversispora eburnea]